MDPWGKTARLSRAQLQDLQDRKLRHYLTRYLYPFSPHYRRLFDQHGIRPQHIRCVADLKQLPFTSKKDFVTTDRDGNASDKFMDFILAPDRDTIRRYWPLPVQLSLQWSALTRGRNFVTDRLGREFRPVFITFTTGTTGRPVSYVYTKYDLHNLDISGERMLALFGVKPDERIINLFPFAPHLAFWQVVLGGMSAALLVLSTGGGKTIGTQANISAILKLRPSVIMGVPSYIYHALRVAHEQEQRMDFIRMIVLGASKIPPAFKRKLADLCALLGSKNVSIFGTYGFTEARTAWAECPTGPEESSGYHLYPDKEIFEVVDPDTGEVRGEGEDGELVYTAIDARGSSVLRFRTGDFVRGGIVYEPCPHCGRTVGRISSNITRLSNVKELQLTKVKGSLINFNNFEEAIVGCEGVEEWQVEICKKDDDPYEIDLLSVYLCARQGADCDRIKETVSQRIKMVTEVLPNAVHFIPLDDMVRRLELETANKDRRIIDRRPST